MQKYKCHKVVEAEEIAAFDAKGAVLVNDEHVELSQQDYKRISAMAFPSSQKGPGYLVKYEDGYLSWSPKDVFEVGYSKI